jgi:hypothetical protein
MLLATATSWRCARNGLDMENNDMHMIYEQVVMICKEFSWDVAAFQVCSTVCGSIESTSSYIRYWDSRPTLDILLVCLAHTL